MEDLGVLCCPIACCVYRDAWEAAETHCSYGVVARKRRGGGPPLRRTSSLEGPDGCGGRPRVSLCPSRSLNSRSRSLSRALSVRAPYHVGRHAACRRVYLLGHLGRHSHYLVSDLALCRYHQANRNSQASLLLNSAFLSPQKIEGQHV